MAGAVVQINNLSLLHLMLITSETDAVLACDEVFNIRYMCSVLLFLRLR